MSVLQAVVAAEDVVGELRNVYDPEIGLDIVSLGLVYEVAVVADTVKIRMTFTTPLCPVGPYIEADVHHALENLPMIQQVEIDVVFDPPWDWSMMSDAAKAELGIRGVAARMRPRRVTRGRRCSSPETRRPTSWSWRPGA